MLRLSAIVPATNSPPSLQRCLAAIRSSESPPDELIVVTEPPLAGPARARNDGARRATGDVLAFVDADVLVHREAFARLRAHFDADQGLAAVLGAYDDTVATRGVVAAFRNLLHHHVHARSAGPAETFWAGLGAVRRVTFEAVGGFDAERFERPSIEDVELGMRLSDLGARIVLDPLVRGTHLKQWSLREMVATDFARRGVPWVRLLAERRTAPTSLNLGWRERAGALVSVVGAIAAVRGRPAVALGSGLVLVALNRPFYSLLVRRIGPGGAAASVPVHMLHHVVGAAAVPAGLGLHVVASRGVRPAPR